MTGEQDLRGTFSFEVDYYEWEATHPDDRLVQAYSILNDAVLEVINI